MPTIETKISQALQARVASLGMPYALRWTDDAPSAPPASGTIPEPYIEAHHEPNRTVRHFVGSNDAHERPGLLLLTLCWPLSRVGTGPGKAHRDAIREMAGKLAEHFPVDHSMDFQGIRVRVAKAPEVLGAFRDDTTLRTQVRVTYTCFA